MRSPAPARAPAPPACVPNRRTYLISVATGVCGLAVAESAEALPRGGVDARVAAAFNNAFAAGGNYQAADKAWTNAINLDPSNASAWSNRGTLRLQFGKWQEAREDLLHALSLETSDGGSASGILLNQLGNAEGAVGEWDLACKHYREAAVRSTEIESIALANLALALCEMSRDEEAGQVARNILRKDPEFLDVRAALTAIYWARGQNSAAEDEWNRLQNAQDGLGGALYSRLSAIDRVKSRWPPRPTAALDAFLSVSRQGIAKGYDGKMNFYTFPAA